jgi:hypothetical protein
MKLHVCVGARQVPGRRRLAGRQGDAFHGQGVSLIMLIFGYLLNKNYILIIT